MSNLLIHKESEIAIRRKAWERLNDLVPLALKVLAKARRESKGHTIKRAEREIVWLART